MYNALPLESVQVSRCDAGFGKETVKKLKH
jgi:hypothetical protein